ncbi:MAG: hypothetical protein J0H44_16615 [Alphaproteobacteria bacterium]|nr:hypothetical protein [Alphaproteobacteria bacterium]
MIESRYEKEEYFEQDEEEAERIQRKKSVVALAILAVLVIAGIFLFEKLRDVSRLQDCLMTRASNCNDMVEPPKPAGNLR